jgi:enoyl-CoA hydratase/carnithine racemase
MPVVTELSEGILTLRLNRPQRLNALTLPMAQALLSAVQGAVTDPRVRVLLLCAEGRAFCAGKDRDDPPGPEFVTTLQALAQELMDCPKPVVAAAQGWAVGGGLELLLNCDVVVPGAARASACPRCRWACWAPAAWPRCCRAPWDWRGPRAHCCWGWTSLPSRPSSGG